MLLNRPSRYAVSVLALVLTFLSQPLVPQSQTDSQSGQKTTANGPKSKQTTANCTNNGTYINSKGETVKRPENCSAAPQGATALCRDGTYSFSQSRRGTCSHHGGVAKWLLDIR
jgi:hypothetical protein